MPFESALLLIAFVVVTVGSPGPANLAFMASGARYGIAPALPFLVGSLVGWLALYLVISTGLIAAVQARPILWTMLRAACFAYILYLAWRIAFAGPTSQQETPPAPNFFRGVLIHPLNPKAYAMITAAVAQFATAEAPVASLIWIAAAFIGLGFWLNFGWLAAGALLGAQALSGDKAVWIARALAAAMVAVTGYSLYLVG